MKYLGKASGFGQLFKPPEPSPYLAELLPLCGDLQRSPLSLALIRDDVKKFVTSHSTKPTDILFTEACRQTVRAFMLPSRVKMLHLNDVFKKDLPIWSSSPGLPWMNHGYKVKRDIQQDPDAIQRIRWFWHRVKAGENIAFPDCCAHVRTHIVGKGETKVRAVWGYPATITFGEAVFALPLIEAYSRGDYPIAYGYETGVGGTKRIYHEFEGNNFLGIDFKSFDKAIPPWLLNIAFDVLAYNIDFGNYEEYGVARYRSMLHMYNRLTDYCINTKIRLCNGERYQKDVGLASGSYFTQLAGSVVNYILLTYACLKLKAQVRKLLVFGDDSLLATDVTITPHDIAQVLEPLGMTVNTAKSGASRYISDLTFLGYKINAGICSRPRDKQFAGLVFPERPDKSWDYAASRALGILYANFGVDPVVDYWCRKIVEFRPFDLVLSRDQQRFIDMMKIGKITTKAPTPEELARRIGYL
uniref:RdRp n=1 Tax=Hubei partiti-like virus 35 TaxID=1923042 RepID=A0A1L3KLU8_9VIRU|nr:RdRp [Hubei partiti-like virus 35]